MTCTPRYLLYLGIMCLSCFFFNTSFAQNKPTGQSRHKDSILHKVVYTVIDTPPVAEGGNDKFLSYIARNVKYPAGQTEYIGHVGVAFVVEPDGSIDGERTVLDPTGHGSPIIKQLFKLAHQVKWTPGSLNGKKVPVLYVLPIIIEISE